MFIQEKHNIITGKHMTSKQTEIIAESPFFHATRSFPLENTSADSNPKLKHMSINIAWITKFLWKQKSLGSTYVKNSCETIILLVVHERNKSLASRMLKKWSDNMSGYLCSIICMCVCMYVRWNCFSNPRANTHIQEKCHTVCTAIMLIAGSFRRATYCTIISTTSSQTEFSCCSFFPSSTIITGYVGSLYSFSSLESTEKMLFSSYETI